MARRALLIGCSKYEHLESLGSAGRDVARLAAVLGDESIGSFEVQCIPGEPDNHPTRAVIESFFAQAESGDTVLLYLACRGFRGAKDRFHLALHDANPKLLLGTTISADFVDRVMRQCPAQAQMLVLDCCCAPRSDDAESSGATGPLGPTEADFEGRGKVVLAAVSRTSSALGSGGHSTFVHALLQGLVGGKAKAEGDFVTPEDLHRYLTKHYQARGETAVPRLWGEGGRILELAKTQEPVPVEVERALESDAAAVRHDAVIRLATRLDDASTAGPARFRLEALLADPEEGGDDSWDVRKAARQALRQPLKRGLVEELGPSSLRDDETPQVLRVRQRPVGSVGSLGPVGITPTTAGEAIGPHGSTGALGSARRIQRGGRRWWAGAGAAAAVVAICVAWWQWDGLQSAWSRGVRSGPPPSYALADESVSRQAPTQRPTPPAPEVAAVEELGGGPGTDPARVGATEVPATEIPESTADLEDSVGATKSLRSETDAAQKERPVPDASSEEDPSAPAADPDSDEDRTVASPSRPPKARRKRGPCERGDPVRCYRYAMKADHDGRYLEAMRAFESACSAGHADACFRLGSYYEWGKGGLSRDRSQAADLYRGACQAKRGAACHALAGFYAKGKGGTAQDRRKAATYYAQACTHGWLEACYTLGVYYEEGRGVARDEAKAFLRYRQACQDGHGRACESVGQYHLQGRAGLSRDPSEAARHFGKACDLGRRGACVHRRSP